MLSINEIQEALVQEFAALPEGEQREKHLLSKAAGLDRMDAIFRNPIYLVKGWPTAAWVRAELHEGRVRFFADAEDETSRAILCLFMRALDKQLPGDILDTRLNFPERAGVIESLPKEIAQGMGALVEHFHSLAAGFCCCR